MPQMVSCAQRPLQWNEASQPPLSASSWSEKCSSSRSGSWLAHSPFLLLLVALGINSSTRSLDASAGPQLSLVTASVVRMKGRSLFAVRHAESILCIWPPRAKSPQSITLAFKSWIRFRVLAPESAYALGSGTQCVHEFRFGTHCRSLIIRHPMQ